MTSNINLREFILRMSISKKYKTQRAVFAITQNGIFARVLEVLAQVQVGRMVFQPRDARRRSGGCASCAGAVVSRGRSVLEVVPSLSELRRDSGYLLPHA